MQDKKENKENKDNKENTSNNIYYRESKFELNFDLTFDLLKSLFSPENLSKVLTEENKDSILPLLPTDIQSLYNSPEELSNFLTNTKLKFFSPLETFYKAYTNNYFTYDYQSNLSQIDDICLYSYISKYKSTLKLFERKLNESNSNEHIVSFDMHSELASSGYSSLDSIRDNQSFSSEYPASKEKDYLDYSFMKKKKKRVVENESAAKSITGNNGNNDKDGNNDRFKALKKK